MSTYANTTLGQHSLTPAETFDQYFGQALFEPWTPVLLEYAAPKSGERTLDLACATGIVARHVAPLVGKTGKVVGLDINPGMLAVACAKPHAAGAPIEWQEGDATALNFPDGSFDLVVCQQGLQFFPERSAAAREMRRVLADGGRVAVSLWQALDHHPVYAALCEAEARHLGVPLSEVATPWSFPDGEALRALLADAGFQRIRVIPRSLEVHFPEAERFVTLTLFAATAFLPEFDWNDEATRSALLDRVSRDVEPVIDRYRDGDGLTFPTHWNIAVADK
jgi:SAM-dependent methyltransferase